MHTHKVIQFSCESCAKKFRVICGATSSLNYVVSPSLDEFRKDNVTREDTFPAKKRLESDDG